MPPARPKQPQPRPGGVDYDGVPMGPRQADRDPSLPKPSMPVPWTDQRQPPPGGPKPDGSR